MVRPAYFFATIISLIGVICSWSLAQEGSDHEGSTSISGQTLTQEDTVGDSTLELISTGSDILIGSGEYALSTGDAQTQSGGDVVIPSIPSETENDTNTPPLLLISEVYFDGSDERIEITNRGMISFSGTIQLTGTGIGTNLDIWLDAGASVVIGRTGRNFAYILDTSVVRYFVPMGFTDTKELSISLLRSGQLGDYFHAETGMVLLYNDKKTSLERIWSGDVAHVVGTTKERQLNVLPAYLANPGSFEITFLDYTDPDDTSGSQDQSSGAVSVEGETIDCNNLISAPLGALHISEIFWGNEQRDFYIEILVNQGFVGNEIILSGSFLATPISLSLSTISGGLMPDQRIIISSGHKRDNEPIIHIDNQWLSPQKSGGFLQILLGSGQSGQVLDIASIPEERLGSSLYFGGRKTGCIRKMDVRGRFSPGFDEVFLRYYPGTTGYKIICEKSLTIKGTESQVISSTPPTLQNQSQTIPVTGEIVPGYSPRVAIISIDYDPEGSDTNNESITLLLDDVIAGVVTMSKPDRYLTIGTTKRYLSGILLPGIPTTLKGSFSFPNTSKSGSDIVVQLWYKNQIIDTYTYSPNSTSSKTIATLTGTFLVTSVVDGDTFKIADQTGEQSIRMLGLDAPEISLLRTKKKGCLAEESKAFLSSLILGKQVSLHFDSTQNKTDSYKRRLNYVYVDTLLVNQEMLVAGYAKEYTFKTPYMMRAEFLSAQASAQEEQRGLRDSLHCPENALTGKLITGENQEFLSGLEAKILWIIPNPKGSDAHEQIALKVETLKSGEVETGRIFLSGASFLINGKTKKIKDSIPLDQETILSGSFSFPNKAACVSVVFQKTILDTLCYPQPKEAETIFAGGKSAVILDVYEQEFLGDITLKKIGNTMCVLYGKLKIDCNKIPSGKTALKTQQQNKLYKNFLDILQSSLQKERGTFFYESNIYPYFSLFWSAKKHISAGSSSRMSSHGAVPVYDISAQLEVIQTFSPGYRAKRFGQVLLNEI